MSVKHYPAPPPSEGAGGRLKLFTAQQVKELDTFTIAHEPVASIDLMERAAMAVTDWLLHKLHKDDTIKIFAGSGNNGGDALAVARLLCLCGFQPQVFLVDLQNNLSLDCQTNRERLAQQGKVNVITIKNTVDFPVIDNDDWVIDGLFGTGLNRPAEGIFADLIGNINNSAAQVVSIDIPSGLFGEDNSKNSYNAIIKANYTLSFQFPKIAFLLPENEIQVGEWEILDIELHPKAIEETPSSYFFLQKEDIDSLIKPRSRFAHKGNFGHALFVGGSLGKIGAAILASRACLRTGVGLVTANIPYCGLLAMQTAVPEVMCVPDKNYSIIADFIGNSDSYSAIGIGCGIGTREETATVLKSFLEKNRKPLVLDADALNILATHPEWLPLLPENTIITPHPKEFERLTGKYFSRWEQIEKAKQFAKEYCVYIVLKGAYTAIVFPDEKVYFNSTGNAGMATAGSGDVLCGMILALLTQGYTAEESALLGVYLHGAAGDKAAEKRGKASMIASDIIENINF